ncbi:hypothetical protein EYZ11_009680 [Aspergillus tanneri]|uniref:Uncharacterized protein n=1 Tax=Aspergillus tanneri TaxID=1220188 RepID=A0A4S3J7A0_9EURO|nr:hypothetical protein EYZ11_009680 [Aspergillus tanneri]
MESFLAQHSRSVLQDEILLPIEQLEQIKCTTWVFPFCESANGYGFLRTADHLPILVRPSHMPSDIAHQSSSPEFITWLHVFGLSHRIA